MKILYSLMLIRKVVASKVVKAFYVNCAKRLKCVLAILLLLIANVNLVNAAQVFDERVANSANNSYWRLLLHYQDGQSIARSDEFFIAKNGYVDPVSELKADIAAFYNQDISLGDDHAICRFPARLKWLQEKGLVSQKLPKVKCKKFEEYLNKVAADELDIVFASENPNSLISMMGHVFLKFSGKKDGVVVEHSLGYFAKFYDVFPVKPIVFSLFPGTEGIYAVEPYRKRLEKYTDRQRRGVWEYKLQLSKKQIERLLLHVWELKNIDVRYRFAGHNCGSALIYLLAVADQDIIDKYEFRAIDAPIDIVKKLNKIGVIARVEMAPSDIHKLKMIEGNFTANGARLVRDLAQNAHFDKKLQDLSAQEKSNMVYAAQAFLDSKFIDGDIEEGQYRATKIKLGNFSEKLPKHNLRYEVKDPLKKQQSARVNLGLIDQDQQGDIVQFGFYPVYNDLLSDNSNFFNEIELSLANLDGRYYIEDEKVLLENIDLIKMKNIVPSGNLSGGLSGSFKINFERSSISNDSGRMFFNSDIKVGYAKNLFFKRFFAYGLVGAGYSRFGSQNVAYGNPEVGIVAQLGKVGKLNINYEKFFAGGDYKYKDIYSLSQSFFVTERLTMELNYRIANTENEDRVKEFAVNSYYYF